MNHETIKLDDYNGGGWYNIQYIENEDDTSTITRKEASELVVELVSQKTTLLEEQIKILTKQVSELNEQIFQLKSLNEREKNIYVRSRIPFRFIPEQSKRNYELPFTLFSLYNSDNADQKN